MEKIGDILAHIESARAAQASRKPQPPHTAPGAPAAELMPRPTTAQASTQPSNVVQLPLWPEPVRGVPNSILRSALFGAIKRGRRTFLQREPVASYEGVTILQTGPRLDQADLDVWEQCLHLAHTQALGMRIYFSAHSFLRAIGRWTGKHDHEWLKNAFARLASSVVEIKDGKRAYFGPMLHHGTRDDETGLYVIEINPAIARLYGTDGWTAVDWEQRMALKGQQLAQWLHAFYSTHADPYPMKVETIRRLCGSENKDLFGFRRELREALAELAATTGWSWRIDENDLVHITKTPTPTQVRHLTRRRGRPPKPRD